MSGTKVSQARRAELIDRFNERICVPSAFQDFPMQSTLFELYNSSYDLGLGKVSETRFGHGALVLAELDDLSVRAIPFAMEPHRAENPKKEDFLYGFHKYVSIEAVQEVPNRLVEAKLDLWRVEDGRVFAKPRGALDEMIGWELDAVLSLSVSTENVTYITTRLSDDAKVKIRGGVLQSRRPGRSRSWTTQTN